jgi:hypothetical protein
LGPLGTEGKNFSMTQNPLKYCGGCEQDLPRTPEFFYSKKGPRFVASAQCKACSVRKALARYYASDKAKAAGARAAVLAAKREAAIIARGLREDGRLQRAREFELPPNRLRQGTATRLRDCRTRRGGLHPDVTTDDCIGCSWPDLVKHIEAQWYDGMSWTNYGSWHIDHIVPISSVDLNDRDAALRVLNFKNLQPLWAHENVKKGARVQKDLPA